MRVLEGLLLGVVTVVDLSFNCFGVLCKVFGLWLIDSFVCLLMIMVGLVG